jgi:hypothetical protein
MTPDPKKIPATKKSAAVASSFPNTPALPTNGTHDPAAGTPSKVPPIAPLHAFPVDPPPEPRRGPGRPPKVCDICGKIPAECKGHKAAEKFSIGDETVKGLITMVSQLTALSFALSTGAPGEQLAKIWNFTEGEKMLLVPPAAELINKNAPEWMLKYETEIKLGFIALPLLIAKLSMTHALVKMHREQLEKEKSSPSPAAGAARPSPAQAAAA